MSTSDFSGDLVGIVAIVALPSRERSELAAGLAISAGVELFDTGAALLASNRRSWLSTAVIDVDSEPDAESVVCALSAGPQPCRVLATGSDCDARSAVAILRAGAADYLFKPALPQQVWNRLVDICAPANERDAYAALALRLSPRERVVLSMLRRALSTKDIAHALALSPRTVEIHRSRILAKTGARRTVDLLARISVWAA